MTTLPAAAEASTAAAAIAIDARLKCPFNMLISGPTQSGKTSWVCRLLLNSELLMERPPQSIHWYSPHLAPPPSLQKCGDGTTTTTLHHHKGLPWTRKRDDDDDDEYEGDGEKNPEEGDVIVIDDFAQETSNSAELTAFLTRNSHHRNISICVLTQNLFWGGKETRTQSLNMHYLVLMRQTRDHRQVRTLGRQLTQTEKEYRAFLDAYNDATGRDLFSYLMISMHPRDDKRLLLRSTIFPSEHPTTTVYLLKKYK